MLKQAAGEQKQCFRCELSQTRGHVHVAPK